MFLIRKIQHTFRNAHIQSLLGTSVTSGFGMLLFAILYRGLSIHDIGIYVIFTSILVLIDMFRAGFLTIGFIKFFAGTDRERGQEVAGSAWCLAIAITLLCIVADIPLYFIFHNSDNEGVVLFVKYFPWIFIATLPSFMASIVVQAQKRFDKLLWLRLINQLLFIFLVVSLILLEKITLHMLILSYVFSQVVTSVMAMFFGWTLMTDIPKITRKTFMELFHFGKFSAGTIVSANLFSVINTFVINSFLGPAALGIYNLGIKFVQIVEMPILSFAASGTPILSALFNNNRRREMMFTAQKMIGMLTWGLLPVLLLAILFADPIIGLLGGIEYIATEAPNLLRIFMIAAIVAPADRYFSLLLEVIHKPHINFYRMLVTLVVYLAICIVGISFFHSVYLIAIAGVAPVVASIMISYHPINRFAKFSFWRIYIIGFREVVTLVTDTFGNFIRKPKTY